MEPTQKINCNRRRGFTLVELMLAVAISTIVVGGILSVFIATQKIAYEVGDVVNMNSSTQFIRNRTIRDFRSVQSVTTSEASSFAGEYMEYDTGTVKTLRYTFSNGNLYRSVNGESVVVVLSDISTTNGSHFIYKTRTGTYSSSSPSDEVIGLEMYIVPNKNGRQRNGMTRDVNIPYKTSVTHFRNSSN